MFQLIEQALRCILSGIEIGFMTFLKVLPICNELGSMKEEIIACIIGVPVIVISIAFTFPAIISFFKKIKA